MAAHAGTRQSTAQRRAQLEGAIARRRERVASLVALAGASAVAALLEPALAPFWDRAAAIAAAAAAATLLAAAGAGSEAEYGLDAMLIAAAGHPRGGALRRRAERISSQRHRRLVARRLAALVARADRAPNRECFQAGLVRLHRSRLLEIARAVRDGEPAAASALARVNRFLWDPGSPLVRRPDDDERFSAWLRQIEVELGLTRAAPAPTPVPVSSRPCRRPTPSST
jgi:hypothetical protein